MGSSDSTSSLLANLVASRDLPPEPVATDALTHLLVESPRAAKALEGIVGSINPAGSFMQLAFSGQAVQADSEGRPDIVGKDRGSTRPRLLIEAKFDAALTASQMGKGYLDWLPAEENGVLIYLVPRNRLPALWPQLLAGPCELQEVLPPNLEHVDEPWLAHRLSDGRVVAAMSWEELLASLHGAIDSSGDPVAMSDLAQLDGLVRSQIATGYIPVAPGDVTGRTGQQVFGLRDAVFSAATQVSVSRPNASNGDDGPGRSVALAGGTRGFIVGVSLRRWANLGRSPIWAHYWSADALENLRIRDGLSVLNDSGGPGLYEIDSRTLAVPLIAPFGAELGATTRAIADQIQRISDLLQAAALLPQPPTTPPTSS